MYAQLDTVLQLVTRMGCHFMLPSLEYLEHKISDTDSYTAN